MPRVAWGNAGAKHSLVVLGGWLDRAPIAYTCSLTRSLHGDAALPVLRLAERPFALSTIPTDQGPPSGVPNGASFAKNENPARFPTAGSRERSPWCGGQIEPNATTNAGTEESQC